MVGIVEMRKGGEANGSGEFVLLGCHIGVSNRIFGGMCGYSGGNERRDRKKPPVWHKTISLNSTHSSSHSGEEELGPLTAIVFVFITDHEHNLPFEHTVVHKAAADP